MTGKRKPGERFIVLTLAGMVLFWACLTDAWGYSDAWPVRNGKALYAFLSRVIWVMPCLLLIFHCDEALRFGRKRLFSRPKGDRLLVMVLAASVIYTMGFMWILHHGFWINPAMNVPLKIMEAGMVGFVEEAAFRGWGYNALAKAGTERKAVFLSTVFFVLLHWPAYLVRLFRFGTADYSAWLLQSLTAAGWGVLCCVLLKRGRTLWNPILAHALYDALYVLFVG